MRSALSFRAFLRVPKYAQPLFAPILGTWEPSGCFVESQYIYLIFQSTVFCFYAAVQVGVPRLDL